MVYTWYLPGIYRLYDNIGDIGGIYQTKSLIHLFGTSHVPPRLVIYLIYTCYIQVYDQLRGVRDWYRTSASKFLCGIYLLCRRCCHIGDIYQVYTRYIPMSAIYMVYTKDIPSIYQRYIIYITGMVYSMYVFDVGSTLVYTWYIPGIYC